MVRSGKRLITALLLCAWGLSQALVGDWKSFTHLDQVEAMITYNGQLYVGTTGGIRQLDPLTFRETVHNNPAEGVLDVHIVGFAVTGEDRLYAVSRNGFLYLREPGGGWITIDRGFDNLSWTISPRAVLAFGDYLLLGSNNGLSFFSVEDKRVEFSLTQFGSEKDLGVTALLMRDSVLYIGTSAGSFRVNLYWPDLENPPSGYGNVFDPQIWETVGSRETSLVNQGVLVVEADSVRAYPMGSYTAGDPEVRAVPGLPLVLGGESFDNITQVHAATEAKNRLFAGDSNGLYEVRSGKLQTIRNPNGLPNLRIASIRLHGNSQYLWTLNLSVLQSYVHKIAGNGVEQLSDFVIPQFNEPIRRNVRGLHVVGEDEFYLGNWGFGVYHYNQGQVQNFGNGNSCLEGVPANPDFVVVRASVPFKDDGLFLGTVHVEGRYKLSYLDFGSRSVTCFDISGMTNSSEIPDPVTLENFKNGEATNPLELRVLGDSLLLVGQNKGVDLYRIRDKFNSRGLVPYKSFSPEETLDPDAQALLVDAHGRLWVSTRLGVYYQDNFLDVPVGSDTLLLLRSMAETDCEHIQEDGRGTLWFGCSEGLIQVEPSVELPAPKLTRLGIRDGLLDPEVVDLQVDPSTGHLWIVSAKGITRFESSGRTPPLNIKSADVYPNPFKPKHPFVVFDNLTENSEVILLNRAGNIVYHAQPRDIDGSQWQWKGTNESGHSVSSGIYYYLIRDGSEVRKGKLIVAR